MEEGVKREGERQWLMCSSSTSKGGNEKRKGGIRGEKGQ